MNTRWAIWIIINTILIIVCLIYSSVTRSFDSAGIPRAYLTAAIGILGIFSLFTFPDVRSWKKVTLILFISTLARLALLPTAPSDDVYRYLWEGKLTSQGISAYQGLADDPVYQSQRDEYWEKMNHRDRPTAYPPLAMYVFRCVNLLGYHPMSYKIVAMLLDLFLIALLLALLYHYKLPLRWSLLYSLSPLSLLSFAAEGHFDIFMTAALVLALLAYAKRYFVLCGIAVGAAVGIKIIAIVIAPLILWKTGLKGITAAVITLLIPALFYWSDLYSVLHALFIFGSAGSFNGPIYQLLNPVYNYHYNLANLTTFALYGTCWLFACWLTLKDRLWSALIIALGSLVILAPIVHFWYLTWVLPLVALRPRLSWITLSITCSLYFLVWHQQALGLEWSLPLWAKWAFWLPFFIFLIAENRHLISRVKFISKHPKSVAPTFSIIIPTFNPGKKLQNTINSLATQCFPPANIIIADAHSTDDSLKVLDYKGLPIHIILTELGRGAQIKSGVENADQEWCVIVHADATLPENALSNIRSAILSNPRIIGGSLGQRFLTSSAGLLLIESLNEFRSTLMHTSFGDQNQFLHRQSAITHKLLTAQPLMEDVEMSDRLNQLGDTVYLGTEGKVSANKWVKGGFWKRFFTVIEFCIRYRFLAYSEKKRMALSQDFYDRYYRHAKP